MANLKVVTPVYEKNSGVHHPEYQIVNTRVSHYLRMYATGKISDFPRTGLIENRELPEDLRNDLLNRNLPLPEFGTDPAEVIGYLQDNRQRFETLAQDYDLAVTDAQRYQAAMEIVNDDNSTPEQVEKAVRILSAIDKKARARSL